MSLLRPDPTFYPSPRMAMQSPPEKLAYVAVINPRHGGAADAIGVIDLDPDSKSYGRLVGQTDMPREETSCIISAGTPAVRVCARMRRIHIWSAAT